MNYEELSFALKVRKIARQRMITEIGDKAEEEGTEFPETPQLLKQLREMDYEKYVTEVIEDAHEAAAIIRKTNT